MSGSFLPSPWFSTNHSLLGSQEPALLCNQVPFPPVNPAAAATPLRPPAHQTWANLDIPRQHRYNPRRDRPHHPRWLPPDFPRGRRVRRRRILHLGRGDALGSRRHVSFHRHRALHQGQVRHGPHGPAGFWQCHGWVYFTGLCEIAGAVGLLLPRFRSLAGICLILLLIAMFPANAKAAIEHLKVAGRPATPLWLRLPLQLVFIALAWWVSRL